MVFQFRNITLAKSVGFKGARGHYVLEGNHDGLSKALRTEGTNSSGDTAGGLPWWRSG